MVARTIRNASPTFVAAAVLLGGLLTPATAYADTSPPLRVPEDALAEALECSPGVAGADRQPILLLPGTTQTPEEFSWNYVPAFRDKGWPYCTVRLPDHAMGDIQVAAEYVVYAIRTVAERSGRDVDLVGHSQGGMVPRWAFKYWPDTREQTDELVGLSPSNHGTLVANAVCATPCAPSFWQQRKGSAFITTLNRPVETWPSIDYTNVYTYADEVVVPNLGDRASSALHTGGGRIANVAVQEVCPGHVADHLSVGTSDPVAYALVVDALTHEGPASKERIERSVCAKALMPYVDPATLPAHEAQLATTVATQVALHPRTTHEPEPAPYVR